MSADHPDSDGECGVGSDVIAFFKSRNWNVVDERQYKDSFIDFIPPEQEGSPQTHSMKMIESSYIGFPTKPISVPPLIEDGTDLKVFYIPGLDATHSTVFPHLSKIPYPEQKSLFEFYRRLAKNEPFTDAEVVEFKSLRQKAHCENFEFQQFATLQWMKHHCSRTMQVPPQIVSYIDHLWQRKAEQCLAIYPNRYKTTSDLPLALNDPNDDFSIMTFDQLLFNWRSPPKMGLTSLRKRHDLVTDFEQLNMIKQATMENNTSVRPLVEPILPASLDPRVDLCLEKSGDIDVVITPSGIKAIVDNCNFLKEWYLPVTIKNVMRRKGESSKKVVIVDKKLPLPYMTIHDKNNWHTKITSKWVLLLQAHPTIFSRQSSIPIPRKTEERELTNYGDNIFTDDEASGTANEESLSPAQLTASTSSGLNSFSDPRSCTKNNNDLDSTIEDLEQFGIDPKVENSPSKTKHENEDNNNEEGEITNHKPVSPFGSQGRPKIIPKRKRNINPSLKYKLWTLHKSKYFHMSKHEQRTLNVMVRTRVDGSLISYGNPIDDIDVCVSSKMEFQPEFGVGKLNASELTREYVDLYLNQPAKLVRVRSLGHTKEVMLTEVKTLADIKEKLNVENIPCHKIFDPLYAVLTKLIDMPVGKYMLKHTSRMGAFTQLLAEDPNGSNLYLSQHLNTLQEMDINAPVVPIDTCTLTALHYRDRVPPALFLPCFQKKGEKFFKKPVNYPLGIPHKKKKKKTKKKNFY